jgi:hypothetical protein
MNCTRCGADAPFIFSGESLCKKHLRELRIDATTRALAEMGSSRSQTEIEEVFKKHKPWLFEDDSKKAEQPLPESTSTPQQ